MVVGGVPVVYRSGSGNAVTNYDFLDVATGKGVLNLYGGDYRVNSVKTYTLSPTAFYAQDGTTQIGSNAMTLDWDFDMKLGRPLTVQGDTVITVPYRIQSAGAGSVNYNVIVLLKKWDGETETVLISGQSIHAIDTSTNAPRNHVLNLDVPKTVFKKGETLRLTLSQATAIPKVIDWFHDPKNRSTINGTAYSTENSQLNIQLPVVVDI